MLEIVSDNSHSGRFLRRNITSGDSALSHFLNALNRFAPRPNEPTLISAECRGCAPDQGCELIEGHCPRLSIFPKRHGPEVTRHASYLSSILTRSGMDGAKSSATIPFMQRNFIRAWRKFRQMTQAQLAEAIDMSEANLSRIETGKQPYTQDNLESVAVALRCRPADLLERDPSDPLVSLYDAIRELDGADRRALEHFVNTMRDRRQSA